MSIPRNQQKVGRQTRNLEIAANRTMPSDKPTPPREQFSPDIKGYTNNPISVAIARDVLRRVREGDLPKTDGEEKPWGS